jgi:WD40 repeat protein
MSERTKSKDDAELSKTSPSKPFASPDDPFGMKEDEELEGDHDWHFRYNRRLSCFSHAVSTLAFSRDGKYLVSGTGSGDAKVWDTAHWSESGRLKATRSSPASRKEEPRTLVFSPAQRWLVAAYPRVLNVFNCKPAWKMEHSMFAGVEECTKEQGEWTCIAFSPMSEEVDHPGGHTGQDNHLAAFSTSTLHVFDYSGGWSADTPRRTRSLMQSSRPMCAAFTNCGWWLIAGFADGQVQVWNAFSLTMEKTLSAHNEGVTCITTSPRAAPYDSRFISCSSDQTIRLWHSNGWILEQHVHETKCDKLGVREVSFSSSGQWLVSTAKGLSVWRVAMTKRGRIVLSLHQPLEATCGAEGLRCAAFCGSSGTTRSSAQDAIAVGSRDGVLGLWTKVPGAPLEPRERPGTCGKSTNDERPSVPWVPNQNLSLPKPMQKVNEMGVKPMAQQRFSRGEWYQRTHRNSLASTMDRAHFQSVAPPPKLVPISVASREHGMAATAQEEFLNPRVGVFNSTAPADSGGLRQTQRCVSEEDLNRWRGRRLASSDSLPTLSPSIRRTATGEKRLGMIVDDYDDDGPVSQVKKNMMHACRHLVQRIQVDPKVIAGPEGDG